ncbi:MAG: histidine phosphatase family protein [Erysipelotrichaceae bacterium]|nr:histidine phosphatase family protein [Erysipelotrichaceae bacterium]
MNYAESLFLRHGETTYNIQEIVQGWNDSPLSKLGVLQAKCTGYGLRNISFVKAYSGDASRQIDSAVNFMNENLNPAEIICDYHFREMCYGKYEEGSYEAMLGPLFEAFQEKYHGYDGLYRYYDDFEIVEQLLKRDETGRFEGLERVWKRVSQGIDAILKEHDEGNILISTSSFTIATVIHKLFPDFKQPRLVENASISIISYNGSYRLLDYNNIEYRKKGEKHFADKL